MKDLTNTILTKVAKFAETVGVIANTADKILSYVLPKDDAAALCYRPYNSCGPCRYIGRYLMKQCTRCCIRNEIPLLDCFKIYDYC
jgi:hypothetical protein